MGYIKSHSNYILAKQHQLTSGGTIYERDITTIGGLNQFSKGQIPIYKSGNFLITVREGNNVEKDYTAQDWIANSNENSDEIWTLSDITNSNEASDSDDNINIKRESYDLRDFAYYGSCSELIRASLTNIIDTFPGELYAPYIGSNLSGITMYYTNNVPINIDSGNTNQQDFIPLYKSGWFLLDNPFNINIYTEYSNDANNLKFLCNEGYKNYLYYENDDSEPQECEWKVIKSYICNNNKMASLSIGSVVAEVTINGNEIVAVVGENNQIVYLTQKLGWHLRPKKEFYNKFINSLDAFEKILMNQNSTPKYSALFEVINENDYGYYSEFKRFTFPTTFGGYNLAINDASYSVYLNNLVDIASFYDETFCDNLYRLLTHESIKNFDWSYTKEFSENDADEYIFGGTRLQNFLRVIGRELDEIKYYIDNINYSSYLTYSDDTSLSEDVFCSMLLNDGWDIENTYPYSSYTKDEKEYFYTNNNLTVSPYSSSIGCCPNGYFITFTEVSGNSCVWQPTFEAIQETESNRLYRISDNGKLQTKIKQYFSDKTYSVYDINKRFLKMLRLNSRQLYRHKGSIEGVEMMLSLFGLKSKHWVDSMKLNTNNKQTRYIKPYRVSGCTTVDDTYDYEIIEYIAFGTAFEDTKDADGKTIDDYNQTKTIVYNTDEYRNGIYLKYQGLPVKNYTYDDKEYLTPYFDKNAIIDGNPYYQMNGGWLWKNYQFNQNNKLILNSYTQTIRDITNVDDLLKLFALPYSDLKNKTIVNVKNLNQDIIIIDGIVYSINVEYSDIVNQNFTNSNVYRYFTITVYNNCVRVGQQVFTDTIAVSSPYGNNDEELHYLLNYENGTEIRVYIDLNGQCIVRDTIIDDATPLSSIIFDSSEQNTSEWTNYFILFNKNYKNTLSTSSYYQDPNNINTYGWVQLKANDTYLEQLYLSTNYFKGNNPHSGKLYDDGETYLDYFRHLFKYAIENNEFDERCYYNQSMDAVLNKLNNKGFDIAKAIPCDKIDYFGDYYQVDNNNQQTIWKYNNMTADENAGTYNLTTMLSSPWNKITDYYNGNIGLTNQIINLKRLDIKFPHINPTDEKNKCFIKYFDSVILKYVSQMLPSGVIIKVLFGAE